ILGWYITSLCLAIYNKFLLSKDHYGFHFPLFTTMIHMMMQSVLSLLVVTCILPSMKPTRLPSLRDYVLRVLPCSMATGLDIGLSNSSLQHITLTFYTMVKSASPVFVLLFAFLFGLEKPTWKLTLIILTIFVGILLTVLHETKFDALGYFFVQLATVLSGLRWALTQVLLEKESIGMSNPFAASVVLAPLMAISLMAASMIVEGFGAVFASPFYAQFATALQTSLILIMGGVLAFVMVMFEFYLISHTSVVTFSIAGVFKEIITIIAGMVVFHDRLNAVNVIGLVISLLGIGMYNYVKVMALLRPSQGHRDPDSLQLPPARSGSWRQFTHHLTNLAFGSRNYSRLQDDDDDEQSYRMALLSLEHELGPHDRDDDNDGGDDRLDLDTEDFDMGQVDELLDDRGGNHSRT
ncbi:triose-phosphate transporter family-domain-containing protein, partial [Polychytrium aggregatum]|uniref:triose-phosphate transporter family-domain-containing protein n=1 Tax=Polychytrium aggregatum TaxID=110093 RepID=UPI0022FE264C